MSGKTELDQALGSLVSIYANHTASLNGCIDDVRAAITRLQDKIIADGQGIDLTDEVNQLNKTLESLTFTTGSLNSLDQEVNKIEKP